MAEYLTVDHLRAAIAVLRRPPGPAVFVVPRAGCEDPLMQEVLDEFRQHEGPHSCPFPFDEIVFPDGRREPFRLAAR